MPSRLWFRSPTTRGSCWFDPGSMDHTGFESRYRTAAAGSMQKMVTGFSMRSLRENSVEWAWDYRSAARLSKRMADKFGHLRLSLWRAAPVHSAHRGKLRRMTEDQPVVIVIDDDPAIR